MRKQLAHGDRAFGRDQIGQRPVIGPLHLHVRIGGQQFGDRLIEPEAALVDQHHRGHAGDRLGHRIDAIETVGIHLARPAQSQRAARDIERVLTPPTQRGDHVGNLAFRDIGVDHGGNVAPVRLILTGQSHAPHWRACQYCPGSESRTPAQQRAAGHLRGIEGAIGHSCLSGFQNGGFVRERWQSVNCQSKLLQSASVLTI